jgi:drug/metabolite transporter (DMT)-like permease
MTKNMNWLYLALVTVACWGLYGIYLHKGSMAMADPQLGRYKAFLFVGIAYFLTAVLAPLVLLLVKGADWSMPPKGMWLSLFAGILGAVGAFFVLLAMASGSKSGIPPAFVAVLVMSTIFAGAPIVNAVVATLMHPPKAGLASVRWEFVLGIVLAAVGGFLVTKYKPSDAPAPSAQVRQSTDH